jgi:hypothetical protein
MSGKSLAIGIVIGIIVVSAIWYFLPNFQSMQQPSNSIKVTVQGGTTTTVNIAGQPYCFTYIQKGTSGLEDAYFSCTQPSMLNAGGIALTSYIATNGVQYSINVYGSPIIVDVSSVQGTTLVLYVTPP